MKKKIIFSTLLFTAAIMLLTQSCTKEITQDERMEWWREARFGMFIHWGLYAIPAGEWKGKEIPGIGEWIMKRAQIPAEEYRQLAKQFNPVKFDARQIVQLAKDAGMKYITITSKHHDGFAMFKSNASKYNIVDATPYGKDIIKELADECHKQGIKICFYYSQARDWNEPDGLDNDWDFPAERNFQKYLDEKVKPQLTEILTQYGPVGLIWFDTPMTISKEQAQELKELVRKLQPECIISGRLGGGVETDYVSTGDNAIPGAILPGDWETPATLNNTWGFKKNDNNWKSPKQLTVLLFDIVSKGGNYLLNIGPDAEGVVPEQSVKILKNVGQWMKVNGESIYGANASPYKTEFAWGNITQKPGKLYLGFYSWPQEEFYLDGLKSKVKKVYQLSDKKELEFVQTIDESTGHNRMKINLPATAPDTSVSVVVLEIDGKPEVESTIYQQADGVIELPGGAGIITKNGKPAELNFGSRGGGADNWTDTEITIDWNFYLSKPGKYSVEIITAETGSHGTPLWAEGHIVDITSDNKTIQCKVTPDSKEYNPRNHYWNKVRTVGGIINFDEAGLKTIKLDPVEIKEIEQENRKAAFNFYSLRLVPAK